MEYYRRQCSFLDRLRPCKHMDVKSVAMNALRVPLLDARACSARAPCRKRGVSGDWNVPPRKPSLDDYGSNQRCSSKAQSTGRFNPTRKVFEFAALPVETTAAVARPARIGLRSAR